MELDRLSTQSLRIAKYGIKVQRILAASLEAVQPDQAVRRFLKREADQLWIGTQQYDLSRYRRVLLVGAGKAGAPMSAAVAEVTGNDLAEGVVIVKDGYANLPDSTNLRAVKILEAGHPVPDERGRQAAIQIKTLLDQAGLDDLVICLISGGGSALLNLPVADVTLENLQDLTNQLLRSGARIEEINSIRKHLDELKGGKLARLAAPAQVAALILSDVVGDRLDVIASGPTVPDSTTFADAHSVLEKYNLLKSVPARILTFIQKGMNGQLPENPKPGDPLFDKVQNVVVGSNGLAAASAVRAADREGFNTLLLTTFLQGEARQAGGFLAALARQLAEGSYPVPRPACLVLGGETTVTLRGSGQGGRNQEMALAAIRELAGLRDMMIVTLATDGSDGPTDAAGAVVTGETLGRAIALNMRPEDYLNSNNAYPFFAALGDLIRTGPTQTNVNDLAFIFAF